MKNMTMNSNEKIAMLEEQVKSILEAYSVLEEYVSELVNDDDNEIITHTNSIVRIAMNMEDKLSD